MADGKGKRTGRVSRLREKVLVMPSICIERGYWMTESYKETENELPVVRRAKGLAKVLENMTIHIEDGELIVGRTTSKVRGGAILPEVDWRWYLEEADTISTREWNRFAPLSEEEKAEIRKFLPYWNGKSLYEKWYTMLPEDARERYHVIHEAGAFSASSIHPGHIIPDYGKVLAIGLKGIKEQVDAELGKLNLAGIEDFRKYHFYKAVNITLKASVDFAARHAALARSLAENENDRQRKAELSRIAEVCEWVPGNPARNFYEAIQSIWFTYALLIIEGLSYGIGFGRADQYLYPFYRKDLEAGRISKEDVRELIALLCIKINGTVVPQCKAVVTTFGGNPLTCNFTVGGLTKEGKDAVNELSYLFLDAQEDTGLSADDVVVRIHKNTPNAFLMRACQVAKSLRGKLKWVSDETCIQQLLHDGKPIDYARDYCVDGCFQPTVGGYSQDIPGGPFNLPLMLELALSNGVSRITGKQIGPQTGDPRKFKSYGEVWDAYKKQVEALIPYAILYKNSDRQLYAEFCPSPYQSALFNGCIEKGIDIMAGGTAPYATHCTSLAGAPNVGDSLAAIKKVVFEDRRLSMDQVIDALDKNFEGEEEALHMLAVAPKFGNDDDYVDSIVNDVLVHGSNELAKVKGIAGSLSTAAAAVVTGNVPLGCHVGALPDGRKGGEPLSEGGISPYQGRNISGPTASLKSVAKLDHVKLSGGSVLNMRFSPGQLKDESNMRKFVSLIRTYCETGGYHVQFNIVDTAMLRDAQKNPARYRDLLVRVATYSAYFVELSPELQEDIIKRIEFRDV
jgi:pyruvate formate-lyase/glycerol dehydratase family glycyl radical enzyme